jgi:drug/metabolite transporter (DMT)-like permease
MHPDRRRPRLGYLLAAVAAAFFGINGSVVRAAFERGVDAAPLSQFRVTVAFALLAVTLALVAPRRLRIARADVGRLAWLGIAGVAIVQFSYFLAVERLPISVALTIQFTGPMLVLLWLRVVHKRRLRPSLYGAVALSVVGSALVVEIYDAGGLDGLGVLFALVAAVTLAVYFVGFERAGYAYDAFTTLVWALGFATLGWLVVSPPWTFPFGDFTDPGNLALALSVVVFGTIVPFLLNVSALRHLPAARVGVIAALEPPIAAVVAWVVHGEALTAVQISGGLMVVAAVAWVQSHAPSPEVEAVPALRLKAAPSQAE